MNFASRRRQPKAGTHSIAIRPHDQKTVRNPGADKYRRPPENLRIGVNFSVQLH